MILLAVSIALYAFIFSRAFIVNCVGTVHNTQPGEVVLDITVTPKREIFTTTTKTSTTTTTSTTSTTTTTTTTSTTETVNDCWLCESESDSTESRTESYEALLEAFHKAMNRMIEPTSASTTLDAFYSDSSNYDSSTETDDDSDDSGWGYNWGN